MEVPPFAVILSEQKALAFCVSNESHGVPHPSLRATFPIRQEYADFYVSRGEGKGAPSRVILSEQKVLGVLCVERISGGLAQNGNVVNLRFFISFRQRTE